MKLKKKNTVSFGKAYILEYDKEEEPNMIKKREVKVSDAISVYSFKTNDTKAIRFREENNKTTIIDGKNYCISNFTSAAYGKIYFDDNKYFYKNQEKLIEITFIDEKEKNFIDTFRREKNEDEDEFVVVNINNINLFENCCSNRSVNTDTIYFLDEILEINDKEYEVLVWQNPDYGVLCHRFGFYYFYKDDQLIEINWNNYYKFKVISDN